MVCSASTFFPMPGNSVKFSVINYRRPVPCALLNQRISLINTRTSNMCKYLLRRYDPFRRTFEVSRHVLRAFHSPPLFHRSTYHPNQMSLTAKSYRRQLYIMSKSVWSRRKYVALALPGCKTQTLAYRAAAKDAATYKPARSDTQGVAASDGEL